MARKAVKSILILNDPNIDGLDIDGHLNETSDCDDSLTLAGIERACVETCNAHNIEMTFRVRGGAEKLSDWITKDVAQFDAIIINPMSCDSYEDDDMHSAIDAICRLKKPIIEVHITNIFCRGNSPMVRSREPNANIGIICGLGEQSYVLAIEAIAERNAANAA